MNPNKGPIIKFLDWEGGGRKLRCLLAVQYSAVERLKSIVTFVHCLLSSITWWLALYFGSYDNNKSIIQSAESHACRKIWHLKSTACAKPCFIISWIIHKQTQYRVWDLCPLVTQLYNYIYLYRYSHTRNTHFDGSIVAATDLSKWCHYPQQFWQCSQCSQIQQNKSNHTNLPAKVGGIKIKFM